MNKQGEKIVLPKDVQIRMLEFFLKTSITRKVLNKNKILSQETEIDKK